MAVNWSKGTLIDAVAWQSGPDGDRAVVRYYWPSADIAWRPRRGDSAPVVVNPAWFVSDVTCDPVSQASYIVTATCVAFINGGSGAHLGRSYKNLKREWEIEMGLDDFHITPEMMGVVKADTIPQKTPDEFVCTQADWMTARKGAVITGAEEWAAAAIDTADVKGKHISYAAWAAAVPKLCPFDVKPGVEYIDQVLKAPTVSITFYRDNSHGGLASFGRFVGVNGTIPAAFGVPDANVAGKWRATGQTVRRVLDQDGDVFFQVTRTMQYIPFGLSLKWDAAKNGGTWTWPTWP
jgi:hypothetical protein